MFSAFTNYTLFLKKVPTFKLSVTLSNLNQFSRFFYSAAAFLAMQSAVLANAIPSVRLSVRHTLVLYPDE